MKGIYIDSETAVTAEVFAVVYVPGRHRKRYPETNVTVMDSAASAMAQAEPGQRCYAARVMGPARSSEGVKCIIWSAGRTMISGHVIDK